MILASAKKTYLVYYSNPILENKFEFKFIREKGNESKTRNGIACTHFQFKILGNAEED